ncbi:hypothetical protein K492DRAFT_240271 [Lichtheimia hyalospora FSU 10163]|nr:hypothetical protein K492DRAFT_240271 [Lichtheimia hyalospora FSU 10163]
MSIQPMIAPQKLTDQEQPADELQLLSRVLRPNLISENTQYGPGLAYNPTMLSTIPDLDLALYDENLHPQQHVLDQYNSFATGIHGFQQYNADVDIANNYSPSPCISSPNSITEDIGGAGIVSTWSVHDINSIGSTLQSQQQQYHHQHHHQQHHHHQVTHSTSGYVSGYEAASWSTPLSPVSNSSTTHSCTSTTKIVRYEWESENNRHYAAITAEVDTLQDDSQNPPLLGPFLVARRHTTKAVFRLDELSIDMNDQIMVHSVVKDGCTEHFIFGVNAKYVVSGLVDWILFADMNETSILTYHGNEEHIINRKKPMIPTVQVQHALLLFFIS